MADLSLLHGKAWLPCDHAHPSYQPQSDQPPVAPVQSHCYFHLALPTGVVVSVPAKLIPRRKTHYTTICDQKFQIIMGCNGMIWMQRNSGKKEQDESASIHNISAGQHELAEAEEKRRSEHAETPYSLEDRRNLARLRCAVECLRQTLSEITPEAIEEVYHVSGKAQLKVPEMLIPDNMIVLTSGRRPS